MGVWGTAVFSDDLAADTRDAFTDYAAQGLDAAAATEKLIAESASSLEDADEAPVFWLALAATQWKLGRLIDSVRDRALQIIESGEDLRRWRESKRSTIEQRKKHLAKLREQLKSTPPKPRKLRQQKKSSTDFQVGDVAVFKVDEQTAVRLCVLHVWEDRGGKYSDICLLGIDDGKPFDKAALTLSDTLGPHFTMLSHEPADRVRVLRHGVGLPQRNADAFRAWNELALSGRSGYACAWDAFPDAVQEMIAKLRWPA
jgi:hypothetical protein